MKILVSDVCRFLNEQKIDFDYVGNRNLFFEHYAPLKAIIESSITWVKTKDTMLPWESGQYENLLVVVPYGLKKEQDSIGFLYCKNPKAVFFKILDRFFREKKSASIDNTSIIMTDKVGKNVSVGCYCYINSEVEIGDNVIIGNNVFIECPAKIGNNSIIHSGVVIGTDGFGYYSEDGVMHKVPHFGGVVIGERVEIGANSCIDRGTMEDTYIGDDTKIDNLCHIAHNVNIKQRGTIIALSCLGGSVILEEGAYVAPGVTVRNQIRLGMNSLVGMGAVVTEDVEDNQVVAGVPAKIFRKNGK